MDQEIASETANGFAELGLDSRLINALSRLGYEEPTPIQSQAIPLLLRGKDMVGQAATGTGKTAAFALPLLHRLSLSEPSQSGPRALVLVPTRELALQVSEAIHRYAKDLRLSVVPVYGGQPYGQQIRAFERGVDIVVATPGRALDHMRRQTLKLSSVQTVVLDEADEMLDMGFLDDIEAILSETPREKQSMLFSATLAPRIMGIAKRHLRDPVEVKVQAAPMKTDSLPLVQQTTYIVNRAQKPEALGRVLDMENPKSAIIFCRTRNEVDELAEILKARGYAAETLHGGMAQAQRDRVIKRLRAAQVDLVLATDVASRGLDIEQLSHVLNYDVPASPETYVHRIGRVGRAGREGIAITLAEPREHRLLRNIEQLTKQKMKIAKVPSIADLRARRMEILQSQVRSAILSEELDSFRVLVDGLSGEFDIVEIALGALKLAHEATNGPEPREEREIELITPLVPIVDKKNAAPPAKDKFKSKSKPKAKPHPKSKHGKPGPKKDQKDKGARRKKSRP